MNLGDIAGVLDTPPAKAVASLIAVLLSPLGKLFAGRRATLDEVKSILEVRKLLDSTEPDYQTLTEMAHERIAHLKPAAKKGTWKGRVGSIVAYSAMGALLCYFAAELYRRHHPWWAGILSFYALGAVINLAAQFTDSAPAAKAVVGGEPSEAAK